MIQIGEDGYQIEGSTRSSLQLDAAGRIDDIASLAEAGAISPAEAARGGHEGADHAGRDSARWPPSSDMPSPQSVSAW